MNKEEILEKSRKENKNQDLYENEILQKVNRVAIIVALILAAIFYVIQIFLGGGDNYALFAISQAIIAVDGIVKAIYFRRKIDIITAIFFTFSTIFFSVIHIQNLFAASTIL